MFERRRTSARMNESKGDTSSIGNTERKGWKKSRSHGVRRKEVNQLREKLSVMKNPVGVSLSIDRKLLRGGRRSISSIRKMTMPLSHNYINTQLL